MIKLKNITKKYDNNTVALNDVSLEIKRGEMIAIMGASGSGKSTLLNILGCMDSATAGEYVYEDTTVNKLSESNLHKFRRDHISFVFQNFALLDDYTAFENAEIPLIAKGVPKKKRKIIVNDMLCRLGVGDLAKKLPTKMSGGQQQRIALARAFASGNELILADEPTGALDKNTGIALMNTFCDFNKEGKTIIIVTHDKTVADFCGRVIYLEDGKIV